MINAEKDNDILIEARDLSIGYIGHIVVSDMDFAIMPGEIVALIGENGSGKSTLLKTLTKELPPISGNVMVDGREISRLSAHDIARIMAIVMTRSARPDYYTCYEMVASGRYPYTDRLGRLADDDRAAIEEAMRLTGTTEIAERYVTDISDGQRQLVMLARAIAQEPRLLILDEPTSFLDIRHRMLFADTVRQLADDKGVAVLMSMHELDIVRGISDRVIALKDGRVDKVGDTKATLTEEYIKELFKLS